VAAVEGEAVTGALSPTGEVCKPGAV